MRVVKVLSLLNKGTGAEFKGKTLKQLEVGKKDLFSSDEEDFHLGNIEDPLKRNERIMKAAVSRYGK